MARVDDRPAMSEWIVNGSDTTSEELVDLNRWVEVARSTLEGEQAPFGTLDLIFVDVDEMAELNEQHMGGAGPTDVLSFPMDTVGDDEFALLIDVGGDGVLDGDGHGTDGPPIHLGDVVVCREVAARQAPDHAGAEDAELTLLVVHGVLHILGHDHAEPDEADIMRSRERLHMARYGLSHPVL